MLRRGAGIKVRLLPGAFFQEDKGAECRALWQGAAGGAGEATCRAVPSTEKPTPPASPGQSMVHQLHCPAGCLQRLLAGETGQGVARDQTAGAPTTKGVQNSPSRGGGKDGTGSSLERTPVPYCCPRLRVSGCSAGSQVSS